MEVEGDLSKSVVLNSSRNFDENTNVETHLAELRQHIQSRMEMSFESLPEVNTITFSTEKYVKDNPQAVIFTHQKDLNLFPVVIEEARAFANKFPVSEKLSNLRDHEFEHIQKIYELGLDIKGIGFLLFKHKGRPSFGGFVIPVENQEATLRDNLRILLAPKTMSLEATEDKLISELLVAKALKNSKSPQEFERVLSDVLFVIGERYLPKRVHDFIQKVVE